MTVLQFINCSKYVTWLSMQWVAAVLLLHLGCSSSSVVACCSCLHPESMAACVPLTIFPFWIVFALWLMSHSGRNKRPHHDTRMCSDLCDAFGTGTCVRLGHLHIWNCHSHSCARSETAPSFIFTFLLSYKKQIKTVMCSMFHAWSVSPWACFLLGKGLLPLEHILKCAIQGLFPLQYFPPWVRVCFPFGHGGS